MNQNQINITFPDTSTEKPQPKPFDPIAVLTPQPKPFDQITELTPQPKPFDPIAALTPQPKPFDPITELTPQQPKIQTHYSIHPPPAKSTQVVSNIDTLTETSEEKPKKTFIASETPEPTASEKKGGSYKKYLKYKLKYLYALKEFYNTNI